MSLWHTKSGGAYARTAKGASGEMLKIFTQRSKGGGFTAELSELSYGEYDVYVYFNNDRVLASKVLFDITLSGATSGNDTITVKEMGSTSTFVEATSSNIFTGNYAVFRGVRGTQFTLKTKAGYAFGMQVVSTKNIDSSSSETAKLSSAERIDKSTAPAEKTSIKEVIEPSPTAAAKKSNTPELSASALLGLGEITLILRDRP